MNTQTNITISEYKQKLGGYVAMLNYRYCNLCVEADPVSLLGVKILSEAGMQNIEDVAQVCFGSNKFTLLVYPMNNNRIIPLTKALIREHPEFKIELMDAESNEPANLPDDIDKALYLRLTMPLVDDERYDLLKDTIKVLHGDAAKSINVNTSEYTSRLSAMVADEPEEEIDALKEEIDAIHELHISQIDNFYDIKLAEIEKGYQRYLEQNGGKSLCMKDGKPLCMKDDNANKKTDDNKTSDQSKMSSYGQSLSMED